MAPLPSTEQTHVDLTAEEDDADVVAVEEEEEHVDDTEEDECCICQDVVTLPKQGFLSSCEHRFHFDCIVTWAKVTNLCPLCKLQFNQVVRKDADGNVVHREPIADSKQVFRPDPRDHDVEAQLRLVNNVRCEICGRGDDEHVLLMCEAPYCMNSSHTYCVGLDEVPSHSWYCSVHQGGPARASDLIARPASTVSSRRRTRRLASLMSNIMSGVAVARRRSAAAGTTATTRTRRGRGRLSMPDGEALDLGSGRPIRGVALSYAVHMSRELQAIQQRADAMFARGDLGASTLYAPPHGSILGSRSTRIFSETDQMWEDRATSQRQMAQGSTEPRSSATEPQTPVNARVNATRISPTFATEYRDIAKRMADAASHDNYASTVSLTIPKTARLRLVPIVKGFFGKLNEREKLAALDAGCLGLLFSWVRVSDGGTGNALSRDLHPHVLDAVLSALEALPVRKEDLQEVRGLGDVLDDISTQSDVALEFRERSIVLSERWREIDPPPTSAAATNNALASTFTQPSRRREPVPSLPTIQSFAVAVPSRERSTGKRKAVRRPDEPSKTPEKRANQDEWAAIAVDYVKAKLYPLYKESKGKMSKDQFKVIVKQVLERFRADAAKMQSPITDSDGAQLTSIAKQRLMHLLDQVYRASRASTSTASSSLATSHAGIMSTYSAVPTTVSTKRPRTS